MKQIYESRITRAGAGSALLRSLWLAGAIMLIFSLGSYGQLTPKASKTALTQIDVQIATMKASPNAAVVSEGERLNSLISDLHPTVYINADGSSAAYGDGSPVKVECDANAVDALYQTTQNVSEVELIIVRIKEQNSMRSPMNLSGLAGYGNLKYVYLLCEYDVCPEFKQSRTCVEDRLSPMFQGSGNYLRLYKVSIPN